MFRAFVVSALVKVVRTTSCHPRAQNGTRPWLGRQQAHFVPDSGDDISLKNTALGPNRQLTGLSFPKRAHNTACELRVSC